MLFSHKKKLYEDINEFNIRINNYNGTFQMVANNLVVPFAAIFAKRLYASDFQVALISSLPAIVSIGAIIPGAMFLQKCVNKKRATGRFFIGARIFFLFFAFSPFVPSNYRASLFVLLYGLMNLPGSIALASWQSFIAGLFPPRLRAQALALRNRISTLVGVSTTLVAGSMLYIIPKNNEQRIVLYQIFFAAAFIFAALEIYLFYKHKEPYAEECAALEPDLHLSPVVRVKNTYTELKSNKKFVSYCIAAAVFHFSWYMAWPLFPLYEIDHLHSNEIWTSIIAAVPALSSAIAYPYWGKYVDKKGNALPLAIAVLLMATAPLFYPMCDSLYLLLPINAINAIGYSGVILINLNTLFEISPEKNRTIYIAYFNTITNIMLAIAPFVGVALKNMFSIQTALIIGGLARMLSSLIFYIRYKKEARIPR